MAKKNQQKKGKANPRAGKAQPLPPQPSTQAKFAQSIPKSTPTSSAKIGSAPAKTPIPEVVSKRMLKRMAIFSGLPTLMGLATFPSCYLMISQGWLEIPNVVVLLLSLGLFALGVLGLSYGVLSASWDEEQTGSRLGWEEFRLNFGRMVAGWRDQRQHTSS